MSDPNDLSAPRDPGSYGRARLMGPAFWLLIVFGLVCIAAGYGVAKFGPQLFPAKPAAAQPTATSFFGPAPQAPPPPAPALATATPPPASAEVARLAERLEALETRQGRAAQASAEALAAAALLEAAQSSRPFPAELAALEGVLPASPDLQALKPYAERGAPSRAALAASFPDYAARAAAASRSPQEDAGLLARIGQTLSRVVTLRRVGDVPGTGVDALIARAERQLQDGDLVAALATLDTLPPAGRNALGPWRERAEGRAVVDRQIARLRNQALQDLAQLARSDG
jgi:hypothetical protein